MWVKRILQQLQNELVVSYDSPPQGAADYLACLVIKDDSWPVKLVKYTAEIAGVNIVPAPTQAPTETAPQPTSTPHSRDDRGACGAKRIGLKNTFVYIALRSYNNYNCNHTPFCVKQEKIMSIENPALFYVVIAVLALLIVSLVLVVVLLVRRLKKISTYLYKDELELSAKIDF